MKKLADLIPEYIKALSVKDEIKQDICNWILINWDELFAFRELPESTWKTSYTNNHIESMNKKIKTKTKMKGCAYNKETLHKQILISKAILLKLI
ncbi:MAG: transposase [Ureaplasma sp.]|nr:transposase [Ureaplasma sp.]